jgi:hypothetical protein
MNKLHMNKLHIICIDKTVDDLPWRKRPNIYFSQEAREMRYPETKRHPHEQRQIAVRIVKNLNNVYNGTSINLLTHSNFIINELNSLMCLYNRYHDNKHGTLEENQNLCKDVIDKYKDFYKTEDILSILLNPEQVTAELQMPDKKIPIKIDTYGMQDTGFYDDVDAMYDMQTRLSQGV